MSVDAKTTDSSGTSLTEAQAIAAFALELDFAAIPEDVVTLAKEHLLDVLGIALASTGFEFAPTVLKGALELGRGDDATAIGSGQRLPAASAALVNGVLAHGLDFDDTHIGSIYHASAPAMATVLAAGQANQANGREALTAFIAALEIGCRLGVVGAGKFHARSFHPTALCGTFAAAAVAGRLAGSPPDAVVSSLGLCGSMAAGILEAGNSWLKRLHPGWAAHSGMAAASLGKAGFLGPSTVFEGHRGFYAAHIDSVPTAENSPTRDIGSRWETRGIALKPYPCCHFIHSFVDAALELRGQFTLDQVARIECPLTGMLHQMVAEPRERCIRPPSTYAALFSVPYAVAVALIKGRVDLAGFYDEPLDDPEVLRIAELTHCVDDPQSDFPRRFPGQVIVTLKDGRVFDCRKPASFGSPDFPLPREVIVEKFMANATRAISRDTAEKLMQQVFDLENAESLESLLALCVVSK